MEDSRGSVLFVDDGELQEVRSVLQELDVQLDHLRGQPDAADLEPPYDLVVSNERRASEVAAALQESMQGVSTGEGVKPPFVAIHAQEALPLRDKLRRAGVDFLVVASVDPQVLRLLFLHSLYGGPERRSETRLPIGVEVGYGLKHGEGTARLLDLTAAGCRIVGAAPVGAGMNIHLRFPSGLIAGRELELTGRIVRVERTPGSGEPSSAIRFTDLDERARDCLTAILEGQAIGARVTPLSDRVPGEATASQTDEPATPPVEPLERFPRTPEAPPTLDEARDTQAEAPPPAADETVMAAADEIENAGDTLLLDQLDRRGKRRATYNRKVTAQTAGATLILIGRDLSQDGMRIAPQPDLMVGSRVRLTVFGGPRQRPVVLPAIVVQDDGEMGMLLRFAKVQSPEKELLAKLLEEQAPVQMLSGSGESTGGVMATGSLFDEADDDLDAIFAGTDHPTDP